MCGLSGVGKTTYAKKFAEENNLVYLGIDEFYAKVNGDECIHENQFEVWIEFFKAIHEAEVNRVSCIIDTNAITKCHREQFLDWFPTFEHHLIYIRSSEELRYLNNYNRKRVIPDEVMAEMYEKFEEPVYYGFTHVCLEDKRWKTVTVVDNYLNKFQESMKWR
jgi:predicted kinase